MRDEMEAAIKEVDPFNMSRAAVKHSCHRSSGSPFASLTVETMERFVASVKENFSMLYVEVLNPEARH